MIAGSVRKISLVALLVATAALLVPGAANAAAPTVYCVVAYGHENPGNCDPQPDLNAPVYAGRIYPTSQPYGYGEKGVLFVEGNATPGSSVNVSVTDGTPLSAVISRRVEAAVTGAFKADLKVTRLGVHVGTVSNPNGISTLTVTVVATSGAETASKTTTIDKYAIAPGDQGVTGKDKYRPTLTGAAFPPASWTHVASTGYTCAVIICLNQPKQEANIRGFVEDDYASAFGHASEIGSVKVKITQGGVLIKDFGDVTNRINSTQAKYDIKVNINDFEPNYPLNPAYTVSVEIKDANGNTVTTGADFDVYPV